MARTYSQGHVAALHVSFSTSSPLSVGLVSWPPRLRGGVPPIPIFLPPYHHPRKGRGNNLPHTQRLQTALAPPVPFCRARGCTMRALACSELHGFHPLHPLPLERNLAHPL